MRRFGTCLSKRFGYLSRPRPVAVALKSQRLPGFSAAARRNRSILRGALLISHRAALNLGGRPNLAVSFRGSVGPVFMLPQQNDAKTRLKFGKVPRGLAGTIDFRTAETTIFCRDTTDGDSIAKVITRWRHFRSPRQS
ncbi:hypothetical protein [Pseudoruegeria sp. HB172150]|uniref:hypothetical protein n=1 Tax=Pseudoruegeria sp. HB172150 TaxID=2721164 RepID=UPI001C130CA7|nr:hypothetical protein [Pseudoruegeria sp. HB172150]